MRWAVAEDTARAYQPAAREDGSIAPAGELGGLQGSQGGGQFSPGWKPAALSQVMGEGRLIFTTLDQGGKYRPGQLR